jgi:hypothetical protein
VPGWIGLLALVCVMDLRTLDYCEVRFSMFWKLRGGTVAGGVLSLGSGSVGAGVVRNFGFGAEVLPPA